VVVFIRLKSAVLMADGFCLKSAILMVNSSLFPVPPQFHACSPIPIVGTVTELSETSDYNKSLCFVSPPIEL
jgi:hypothetical protein